MTNQRKRNDHDQFIEKPKIIAAAGQPVKIIEEYFGCLTGNDSISIAHMDSPCGRIEPAQRPGFDEFLVVLQGVLHVETTAGIRLVEEGQAVRISKNQWVRYSTPEADGAEYISVCLPAFTEAAVNRNFY